MKNLVLVLFIIIYFCGCLRKNESIVMTVNGPLRSSELGTTLTHEHILVDFIGADSISMDRWKKSDVAEKALPYLEKIKSLGVTSFIDCTPEFLGRDPLLLKRLSDSAGMNIITNTGYYGARNNKFLPDYAFNETDDQLSDRWIREFVDGIEDTKIKPGFIKIGVDEGPLSEIHRKLIRAAARTHLKTGLVIASHTGTAVPAFEQIEILRSEGVSPEAFIWVHAQSEKDPLNHIKAARSGAWISLDGIDEINLSDYLKMIGNMKDHDLLNRVLLSHDAGWYDPAKDDGGEFRDYNTIPEKLVPMLRKENYSEKDIEQLLITNPREAFIIRIRK